MNRTFLSSIIFTLFFATTVAYAQDPPDWYCDKRWTQGRAILKGTVTKIQPATALPRLTRGKFKKLSGRSIDHLVRIQVDKVYRTDFASTPDELVVPNLRSATIGAKSFKVGERYLFYLDAITEMKDDLVSFYIDPEGASRTATEVNEAIVFLETSSKRNFMTEVLGYEARDGFIGGIVGGKAVHLPKPVYPEDAKKSGWTGEVRVAVLLEESGQVIRAKALCVDLESIANASETAALRSKYAPTVVSGKAVKVRGVIVYNFVH